MTFRSGEAPALGPTKKTTSKSYTSDFITSSWTREKLVERTAEERAVLQKDILISCTLTHTHCHAYLLREFYDLVQYWISRSGYADSNYPILIEDMYHYLTMFELLQPLDKGDQMEQGLFERRKRKFTEEVYNVIFTKAKPRWKNGKCQTFYGEVYSKLCPGKRRHAIIKSLIMTHYTV